MNRNEKIRKLTNAVKEWRGAFNPKTNKWIKSPNPAAAQRVCRWLEELDIDAQQGMTFLANVTSMDEFNKWLRTL